MFETIAWISLGVAFCCAIIIAIGVARHPQQMGIMNERDRGIVKGALEDGPRAFMISVLRLPPI